MCKIKKNNCVLLYLCNGTINYAKTRNHFPLFFWLKMYKPEVEKHSSGFFFASFEKIENYDCINFVYTSDLTMCMFVKKILT